MALATLPPQYAAVMMTAVVNWFVLMWMAMQVGSARKEHGVKYPLLYENKVTSKFDLYVVHESGLSLVAFIQVAHTSFVELPADCLCRPRFRPMQGHVC